MVQKFRIYLLWLLTYDCFYILHFDFRFGQEVKVKLGHLFVNIFWQLTICTMVQKLWIYLLWLLRYYFFKISKFYFRFGQEVKVKLRSLFYKYFLTINDLYKGAKIVNLPLAVVEIWFFLIVNFYFRFGQEVKVKLGSLFCKYFFRELTICTIVHKLWIYLLRLLRYDFFKIFNFDFRFGQEVKVNLGHLFVIFFEN